MELTDTEKQAAAQACRVAAFQASSDAGKQSNPTVRATFEAVAKRYERLAEKFGRDLGAAKPANRLSPNKGAHRQRE